MPDPAQDPRDAVYRDLHHNYLPRAEEANRFSAQTILPMVFRHLQPKSVLDVGCGMGTWLQACKGLGVETVQGIEGPWLDRSQLVIANELVQVLDLEQPFDMGRRYDMVISTEVAEHLSPAAASTFLQSLARHADVVLFSAAIPFQPGHHHVNEQFPDYWASIFRACGYVPLDFIRREIWTNEYIILHFRQNLMLFVKEELTKENGCFSGLNASYGPLSIVHPAFYRWRLEELLKTEAEHAKLAAEHTKLLEVLGSGTAFRVERKGGQLVITRTG